ncbi:signal transduction histidine kinase LytS [Pedobacter metabolipauper]|uniref:Signal transduction histidine kinase LytS n=1 Tax=Pedobacter metabolipauper TaxID=425513 RepID=A0A4R6SZE2_9SPHI|nr:signal transduction histidine kinase LytS [Pedobacter metabolipauper]
MIFIAVITVNLLIRAFFSLPDYWLFFLTSGAVENFACALIAYVLYYFVFQLNGNWKKIGFSILFITMLLLLASLKDYRIHDGVTFEETFEYFTSFLGQSVLCYLFVYTVNRFEFLGRYQKLERELNQAKEQLLRNQLHPHFLFNAFNSLYSLSLKNDPETSDYILKLSGMMRYLTDETHLNKVPLHREIDFIEKYIAIEKIRFGEDARIKLSVEDSDNDEKWIEPFLLITLVENAFKHGFYTNIKDAFVKIDVNIGNKELLCTVENSLFTRQHFQESNREGKGLENLKKRLELLYPKSSSIKISNTPNTYTTRLKIMLNNEVI